MGFQRETLVPWQETISLVSRSAPSIDRSRIQASRAQVNPALKWPGNRDEVNVTLPQERENRVASLARK